VRAPDTRGWFVPANDLAKDQWFVRDVGEMARARGLSRVAPFWIDLEPTSQPAGWPRPGQTQLAVPNNHLQYAFTWFGIALTLVGVFGTWAWQRIKIPGDEQLAQPPRPS
jgi:surfeit locus 1 family protein